MYMSILCVARRMSQHARWPNVCHSTDSNTAVHGARHLRYPRRRRQAIYPTSDRFICVLRIRPLCSETFFHFLHKEITEKLNNPLQPSQNLLQFDIILLSDLLTACFIVYTCRLLTNGYVASRMVLYP